MMMRRNTNDDDDPVGRPTKIEDRHDDSLEAALPEFSLLKVLAACFNQWDALLRVLSLMWSTLSSKGRKARSQIEKHNWLLDEAVTC